MIGASQNQCGYAKFSTCFSISELRDSCTNHSGTNHSGTNTVSFLLIRSFDFPSRQSNMSSGHSFQRVAFLGMGLMGTRMSANLVRAGFSVHVYNRTPAKMESAIAAGAKGFDTAAAAVHGVDVVITCVTDGPDVESILFGDHGACQAAVPGALFIDMSTIAPETSMSIGARLQTAGFRYLEAPVTGGTVGAEQGTLSILVGGAANDLAAAMPILEAMGRNITHCGPLGCGQGVKLCNQIMGAMNILGVCEAMSLAKGLGIDPSILGLALQGGAATSWALQNLAPKISAKDWSPGFMIDTQQKDMRLVAQAAESAHISLPGSALVTQLWRSAQAHGHGSDGIHALFQVFERLNHVDG
jgi:3-hydroxyisobutyrate dehydrogenase